VPTRGLLSHEPRRLTSCKERPERIRAHNRFYFLHWGVGKIQQLSLRAACVVDPQVYATQFSYNELA
jgi:hypothetical protein